MHANVALDISGEARADRGQWLLEWASRGRTGRRDGGGGSESGWLLDSRVASQWDLGNEAKLKNGSRRTGRFTGTQRGSAMRNENRDGHYCAPVCDSLSEGGNI